MSGEHDTAPTLDHDGYDSDGIYRGHEMSKPKPIGLHTSEMALPPEPQTKPHANPPGYWPGPATPPANVQALEARVTAQAEEIAKLRGVLRIAMGVIERVYQARHEVETAREVVTKALS